MSARTRYIARQLFQLRVVGRTHSGRPSAATDTADSGCGAGRIRDGVWTSIFDAGKAIHSAGEVVAGSARDGAVQHSERAAADGGIGIQLSVSLVCGSGYG